ncbi:MAG: sugar ABC transporter permease [Spirochaetales bacterium]|nr:sugar ABC transporter permease [Candidatus Physcosoma equi]
MKTTNLMRKTENRAGWLFILPFMLMFVGFKLYPMISGFWISFLDRNSLKNVYSNKFVWFKNYIYVFKNADVRESMVHTLEFSAIYTVLMMSLSLVLAAVFNHKFKGRGIVRTMFYMPYVTNFVVIGIVWKYLLNPYDGPVNKLLGVFIPQDKLPQWLLSFTGALPTTAIIATWVGLTFALVTFLAAMQDIPEDLYEVASIEGATPAQVFFQITLPLLKPTFFMLLTIVLINSFKNFNTIVGLTEGGPGTSTMVMSFKIYNDAFKYYKYAIASAEGMLMTIVIFIVNTVLGKLKKEN